MIVQFTANQAAIITSALHCYIKQVGLSDVTLGGQTVPGVTHLDIIHGITVALRNGKPDPVVEDSPKESEDNVVPLKANGEDDTEDETVTPS